MTFRETSNMAEVAEVLRDPRCYRRIQPDGAPDANTVEPVPINGVRYIIAEDGAPRAVFLLWERDPDVAEVHFSALPALWGRAGALVEAFLLWAWQNTPYVRLSAKIPSYNRLCLRLAKSCGFEDDIVTPSEEGTKHGKPFWIHWMHIYRPEEYAKCA
jgi:RimJ/RimL family protein N-acetyltransferase